VKGAGESTRTGSPAEFRRLVVHLGIAMVAAGDAVDVIEESLRRIVAGYGVAGLQVALLPTSLFVQTGTDDRAHGQFSSQVAPPLRLDQIDRLYRLVKQLEPAKPTVDEASHELGAIYHDEPTFRWPLRPLGHAVLTVGLVLLLQPTPEGIGMLAIATMEIAAGQMVSGASRLVNGFVQLALLAFGIVAAGSLVRASPADFADHRVAALGAWAGWAGVIVFALGIYLHFSAPFRSLPWILLVLYVAARAMSEVLVTIISISLGVLTGAAAYRAADAGVRRLTRTPS